MVIGTELKSKFKVGGRLFYVSYAESGRCSCKCCGKCVGKGSVKITERKWTTRWRVYSYYHPNCAVKEIHENLKRKKGKWATRILEDTLKAIQLIGQWRKSKA